MKILSAFVETVLTLILVPLTIIGFILFLAAIAGLFMCIVTGTKEGILPCVGIIFACVFVKKLAGKL